MIYLIQEKTAHRLATNLDNSHSCRFLGCFHLQVVIIFSSVVGGIRSLLVGFTIREIMLRSVFPEYSITSELGRTIFEPGVILALFVPTAGSSVSTDEEEFCWSTGGDLWAMMQHTLIYVNWWLHCVLLRTFLQKSCQYFSPVLSFHIWVVRETVRVVLETVHRP